MSLHYCFSRFTFQTARSDSEVRQDNLLADFDKIPEPKKHGKHRSCYVTYTNLCDVKKKHVQSEETRKSSRDQSYSG